MCARVSDEGVRASLGARLTHNAVLHAEAKLVLEVRPLDEDGGDGRAADEAQPDLRVLLQALQGAQPPQRYLWPGPGPSAQPQRLSSMESRWQGV